MPLRPMFHRLTQSLPRYQIPKTLRQHTASNHRAFTTSPRMSSSSSAITDKSRILEKPARFNPPSHGSRRVRPRAYPGPRLSEAEVEQQRTKRYPNMMPPEGSFMFRVLTNRSLHLWITLSTLTSLAIFAWSLSFLQTTHFRSSLPSSSDLLSHPITSFRKFLAVYKLHVAQQSEEVAQKRRKKLEDVEKRKEFLREHGVEPGFLTGSWMERFGTVEGDVARERMVRDERERQVLAGVVPLVVDEASPKAGVVAEAVSGGEVLDGAGGAVEARQEKPKKPLKMWFGIW